MRSAIAIRHVRFEDLGTLEPLLRERGYAVEYVDAAAVASLDPDAGNPDLLVALGGPIGAFDEAAYPFLSAELEVIRRRLDSGRPILGICLGAQLMARALGAGVAAMGVKEIGFGPVALTDDGRSSALATLGDTPVLHWHGDRFDIPRGTVRLAGTDVCDNQAFAAGPRALGLQFHLEADAGRIEEWLVGHAVELAGAGIDPCALRADAATHRVALAAASRRVFTAWLDTVEP